MLAAVVLLAVEERSVEAATVPLLTWILGGLGMYMIIAALPWDSD